MAQASQDTDKSDPLDSLRADIPWLHTATMRQALAYYEGLALCGADPVLIDQAFAELGRHDRFFLLTHLLHRADAVHPWLYARCREVEADTDDHLDLWARDHYKSTIITFTGSIQEILRNPEITIGIFSHTRPIAKKFMNQIKTEFEQNADLKRIYPDVLYAHPSRESPSWSLDAGIVVKRKSNPKEKTVEAWGLVDGQPTGSHFGLGVFDDVVTRESVTTPDQILKTIECWELAQNLLSSSNPRRWMIGTMYKYGDPHHQLKERKAVKPRVYAATDDGTFDGKPVFLRPEVWEKKKAESSAATIAAQQLQNPSAGKEQEMKPEWLRPYEVRPRTLNVYILCDYAGSRASTGSSRTAIAVVGHDVSRNWYLLDGVCHKMDLGERWDWIKRFRKHWISQVGVQIVEVGYERFGAQSDIEHFKTMMDIEGEYFDIKELNWPRDGDVAKDNRIRRLIPDLKNWRGPFVPYDVAKVKSALALEGKDVSNMGDMTSKQLQAVKAGEDYLVAKPIKHKNEDGRMYDLVEYLLKNEYIFFPHTTAKDLLDAMSRIYDMEAVPPIIYNEADTLPAVAE